MKTYLCGGINGLSDSACHDWREVAKSLLRTETLNPMRRDYRGREGDFTNEIVDGDINDIKNSQFILVNATKPSWGTAMEIAYARRFGIPVVAFVGIGPVSPWLAYHCTSIHTSLERAIIEVNRLSGPTYNAAYEEGAHA
jgi:nucleoside 2-deoxyribosyltransferase